MGLRADLRWLIFQGANPPTRSLGPSDNPGPSDFEDRIYYNGQLGLSVIFIL
ncbi:MAG: hypothetical protein HC883_03220 [Bdellovibrionaceae bacterium]|nr:hypothetical protein [Pseudobdellovibrionaceae bacterium]